jgi:hypothetical protein
MNLNNNRDPNTFKNILNSIRNASNLKIPSKKNDRILLYNEIKYYGLEKHFFEEIRYLETKIFNFFKTTILNVKKFKNTLIERTKCEKWKLIYKAKINSFSSKMIHDLCDNKNSTLIIIKDNENKIFGGYNHYHWSSNNEKKNFKNGFLFIINGNDIIKFDKQKNQKNIINNKNFGPVFGNDLIIQNNCNLDYSNVLNIGYSYINLNNVNNNLLKKSFRVTDLEVFEKYLY